MSWLGGWDTLSKIRVDIPWALTSTEEAVGFTVSGGTTSKTLTVDDNITASTVNTAVGKAHNQGTDLGLDAGGTNPITAVTIKGHVDEAGTPHVTSTEKNTWNGKTDKVAPATAKNLAGLTETVGNLEDSGITPAIGADQFTLTGGTGTTRTLTIDESKSMSHKMDKASNLSDVADAPTAFANIKQDATTSASGVVELATDAEAIAKTGSTVIIASNLAALFQIGTDTFNSDTGVSVALSPEMSGTDYHVTITPLAESGFIGEIVVSSRATNAFTVKCSGSDTTTTFAWKVSEV